MTAQTAYDALLADERESSVLDSVAMLLGWDERTMMPAAGAELRANQCALLARLRHERATHPRRGEWLAAIEGAPLVADAASDAAVNVRELRRAYDRAVRLPGALIEELARTQIHAQRAWAQARQNSSFADFAPWLTRILDLKREEARCVGYAEHPYDALLDAYEPGITRRSVTAVFESLREPLIELVCRIRASGRVAPVEILERRFPREAQERLAREAAAMIGFDFGAGRLDVSVHPFCAGIGPGDTRMTTRYDEHGFGDAFFGVLHETGHGLYSQGLPAAHFGSPRGEAAWLTIHESQSRLWENFVGRSRAFWRHFLPRAREVFPEALAGVSEDQWIFAINAVRPSFIRTEADEVTYNLHVLLRFEIEAALVGGGLDVADVPGAWNARMRAYLGVTPPDDARGCLQDVHWSGGGIGYFPTYTLGNLCAAQFFEQARAELGDLDAAFAAGEFSGLLAWLRTRIHVHGQRYRAPELVKVVTGKPLSAEPLLRHLRARAAELYGV